jgi:hypothetical protein
MTSSRSRPTTLRKPKREHDEEQRKSVSPAFSFPSWCFPFTRKQDAKLLARNSYLQKSARKGHALGPFFSSALKGLLHRCKKRSFHTCDAKRGGKRGKCAAKRSPPRHSHHGLNQAQLRMSLSTPNPTGTIYH